MLIFATNWPKGLTSLATRLDAKKVAKATDMLAEALVHATDTNAREELALGLTSFVARLDAAEAAKVAKTLVDALEREKDAFARQTPGRCFDFAGSAAGCGGGGEGVWPGGKGPR